jgi:hypothetical protein
MSEKNRHPQSRERGYRTISPARGEHAFQVVVEETDLWVVAGADLKDEIAAYVHELRGIIKAHIAFRPDFLKSMVPLDAPPGTHPLLKTMYEASSLTGVGPMAGVAGAIAQAVADRFKNGSQEILVENGGDLYMHSARERVAAILSDPSGPAGLGVRLTTGDFPISLCSSSAKIGHSVSLGRGDLAVAGSRSGAFADCAATALCNMLQGPDDLKKAMDRAASWRRQGLVFAFAQCAGKIAVWGELELAALE